MNIKNKKCIRRLSWRTMKESRMRNIIAIVAIALTTMLFTSLFTVAMSMNSSFQTYNFRQNGSCAHGTFKDVTEKQASALSAHSNVKAAGRRTGVGIVMDKAFTSVPAEILYMDENCTKWCYAKPTSGRMPKNGNEITMDDYSLKMLGIKKELGTKVTLTYNLGIGEQSPYEKTDTFTLVGWYEYDEISPIHYINVTEDYADSIEKEAISNGMKPFKLDLDVMMSSSINISEQMEKTESDLGYSWETSGKENSVRYGVNPGYTSVRMGENMDVTTIISIIAFLVLVILTGYLIIYNIFQISVTGDIRFYGLLKTIGVTPKQLKSIIRHQALLLCIVGIPVGLMIGYGIGSILTPFIMDRTSYGSKITTLSISPFIFLASALFALITVLLSCFRPGRIAAKILPVEAAKYTDVVLSKKKKRAVRGAKVYNMAFANLGRNKIKTTLVAISLSLSVVLLNILVIFVGGFDTEKYFSQRNSADFVVSNESYFGFSYQTDENDYLTDDTISEIEANTSRSSSGCAYTLSGTKPVKWITEKEWKSVAGGFYPESVMEETLDEQTHRGDLVEATVLLEGLDNSLFDKLTIIEGSLDPLFEENINAIALVVGTDDYGNAIKPDYYPTIGDAFPITYITDDYDIDKRTGQPADNTAENYTPNEYREYYIAESHDIEYTVCAIVTIPYDISYRYSIFGYEAILPANRMEKDSEEQLYPLFYTFDTTDSAASDEAEKYLDSLTSDKSSGLLYESKTTLRKEFESFQKMFMILGGLLCTIIGLVGILNFINAIMTGIISRSREFAILQSIGMTNRQLKSMLIYEGMFYSLAPCVIASLLAVILNPLIGTMFENMFWFFSKNFTIIPVLIFVPVFALLGWLIPSIMYRQSTKQSIVERLRESE